MKKPKNKNKTKTKKKNPGPNTGKKYEKPLSLDGLTFEEIVDIALKKEKKEK